MNRLIMIFSIIACIALSSCQYVKDKIIIPKEPTQEQDNTIKPPTAEQLYLPKISGTHEWGYDLWEPGKPAATYVGGSDRLNGLFYAGINERTGTQETAYLIVAKDSPEIYSEETMHKYDIGLKKINKVVVINDSMVLVCGQNTDGIGSLIAFNPQTSETLWNFTIDETVAGEVTDIINVSDGSLVMIQNIMAEQGFYVGYIAKLSLEGKLEWKNSKSMSNTDMFFDKIIEADNANTFLLLGHIYEEIGYKIFRVEQGKLAKELDLSYIANNIKKMEDNLYLIMGTSTKDEPKFYNYPKFDTTARMTQLDGQLNIIYNFNTEEVNQYTDFSKLSEKVYLFVGNKEQDLFLTVYFDNGTTLEPIKTESYERHGIPYSIDLDETYGCLIMADRFQRQGSSYNRYCYSAYAFALNTTLDKMYSQMLDNNGEVRYLIRGEQARRSIALAIAAFEGHNNLMYIRFMKSDGLYAFVITGKWDNNQIIDQYLLKKEDNAWVVKEHFEPEQMAFEKIKQTYPDFNTEMLPPYELADYEVKVLEKEELSVFIDILKTENTVDDIMFCSYIDEYFYVIFDDNTNYLIKNPESGRPEIYEPHTIDYYNLHLINDDRPPYMLFMQD